MFERILSAVIAVATIGSILVFWYEANQLKRRGWTKDQEPWEDEDQC